MSKEKSASSALHILLSPDGYYTYLGIEKPAPAHKSFLSKDKETSSPSSDSIDKVLIQKNYRKLSLRLHPDRPTGDEEAFRVLERAKNVLLSDKLRKQYDLLGLDLEEDEHADESHQEDENGNTADDKKDGAGGGGSSPDTVMSHMASATVAAFLQMAVRTVMMALTSLYLTKWKYTTIPAILFLLYTSFQIFRARKETTIGGPITTYDILSPILIATGVSLMYLGKNDNGEWTKTFWIGEALVMTLFCLNTISSREASTLRPSIPLGIGLYIIFGLISLYIRGRGWKYVTFLSIELGCALIAVIVFPMMEMVMETLMDEKLRKVGERVRHYSRVMEENYQKQLEEMEEKYKGGMGRSCSPAVKETKNEELD